MEFLDLPGEQIPLADGEADTVLVTYTLCTIPDVHKALGEMRRVMKPNGRMIFCEHGEAPDARVKRWQERLTPAWKAIGGGCHLGRAIPSLIADGGFRVEKMETMYLPGTPRFAGFNYWGDAVKAVVLRPTIAAEIVRSAFLDRALVGGTRLHAVRDIRSARDNP